MAIDIEGILRHGYERTVARNGLLFAAILFVISVLDAMFSPGAEQRPAPPGEMAPPGMESIQDIAGGAPPISLGLSPGVASVLSLLLGLVAMVVTIAAIRTFVGDETETLPREHFTEDIPWTMVNLLAGSIVFTIALAIGFAFLILPGLFLLVSLFLWEVFVAVEDDNFVEGFRHSWDLTGGRRLRLFVLGVVVIVVALIVSIAFAIPGVFLPEVAGFLIEQVGAALVGVFVLATVAETYNRLVAAAEEEAPDPTAG
ncbi:MAG: hypothetical protein ABEH66_04415 [Halobacteriales archaeon]